MTPKCSEFRSVHACTAVAGSDIHENGHYHHCGTGLAGPFSEITSVQADHAGSGVVSAPFPGRMS